MADVPPFAVRLTQTYHRAPYPSISPARPELLQTGRNVLVTGGSEGIGYEIAKAFLQASASKVVIIGRRAKQLQLATTSLAQEVRDAESRIEARPCDMSDPAEADRLWNELAARAMAIDVLILNAAAVPDDQTVLERGTEATWRDYNMNVRAQLHFAERFYKQTIPGYSKPKSLVHVSSLAIHNWHAAEAQATYGISKNAGALVLQRIAQDVGAEDMQIVTFNPGPNLTRAAREKGYTENAFFWNHPTLAGQFAVWAASSEARFLHGRFVWNEWDVDELKSGDIRKRIDEDESFLRIGVVGL
ncbi:hypothetical protein VTK73DRAFT_7707 [Phialemonium thermophilum]|uniref:Uncharacterized protein n=1 Tax=Phialemonium thermophilum TaxID=223376 RepID=A0ABR3WDH2_9PEZI